MASANNKAEESDNYIGLNVGGKIYRTSRTTLTRYANSFFDGLLDCGVVPSAKDDQGNYVIDRDGEIFRHVINFLRYGELVVPARFDDFHLQLLEQEADFFMLGELKAAVKEELKRKGSTCDMCDTDLMIVGLNVGGKVYRTSRSTIRRYPYSFFSRLLDGVIPSAKDDQGNYMIDRDGEIFQHVLNFMTSGELVLPENFDELALLGREADFFLLEPLKVAMKERLEMVGFVINFKVFKLRQEDVLRYKDCLLADMVNGKANYPKDTQGNHVIEWEMDAVDYVMNYIRSGGIVCDITTDQLRILRDDAADLQLQDVENHCQSVEFMEQNWEERSVYIHVYHWVNGPCIAYINKTPHFLLTRRENISIYNIFFDDVNEIAVGQGKVSIGAIALKRLKEDGKPSVDDIVSYFTERVVGGSSAMVNRIPLQNDSTLIEVTI